MQKRRQRRRRDSLVKVTQPGSHGCARLWPLAAPRLLGRVHALRQSGLGRLVDLRCAGGLPGLRLLSTGAAKSVRSLWEKVGDNDRDSFIKLNSYYTLLLETQPAEKNVVRVRFRRAGAHQGL